MRGDNNLEKTIYPGRALTVRYFFTVAHAVAAVCVCTLFTNPGFAEQNLYERTTPGTIFSKPTLVDGSGEDARTEDVLIVGGRIEAIGDFLEVPGDEKIDAAGLVLAPGFIDSHSHHDEGLQENPHATAAISQGITTIVVGLDGTSSMMARPLQASIKATPVAINVATYTGHGSLRSMVMGNDYRREASSSEVTAMSALLERELAAGSLGLSTGLEYDPGIYSNTGEVIALAKVAAVSNGRYISHMRSEDRNFEAAIEELLQIGEEADIPVQISHIKLASVDLWGQAGRILKRLDVARAAGIDVTADIYPYTYWEASLSVLLPKRDFNDLEAANYVLEKLAPAPGLTLTYYEPNPKLVGKNIAQIATASGQAEAETFLKLLRDAYDSAPNGDDHLFSRDSVMGVSMTEEDIAELIAWPHTNICSDGGTQGHPRGFGAFPRAIHEYVVKKKIVSLEEMIRKMTSLSASHLGLKNRGSIELGYAADLVLLDINTLKDNASIANNSALSTGIVGVWVGGERVWSNAAPTGAYPGKFISP
ncbi:MAG: N-acyl-D-amino-acid deacylase [Halioglobus sp.]